MLEARVADEVRRAEQALYDAMVARDFAALQRLLAPDLVYVHSTAVAESRDAYLAGVTAGAYEYERVASRDVRLRGNASLVVEDGVCEMRVGARGRTPDDIRLLFVLVWSKTPSGWQLLHRHATRMTGAAAGTKTA